MIFCDASALVAIIAAESEADDLADALERDDARFCSALSVWETVAGLCRSYAYSVNAARTHVQRFLGAAEVRFVSIGAAEFELAADAYAQFGRGRHRAALNMGDCYAYACAKGLGARLLFKGDGFARTDIESALS